MSYDALLSQHQYSDAASNPTPTGSTNGLNILLKQMAAAGVIAYTEAATAPGAPVLNDLWFKPDTGLAAGTPPAGDAQLSRYDGAAWQAMTREQFAALMVSLTEATQADLFAGTAQDKVITVKALSLVLRMPNIASIELGDDAGGSGSGGVNLGFEAGISSTGNFTALIGYEAGKNNTGASTIAMGYRAMMDASGNNNVGIGVQSGQNNTGSSCTFVGTLAGFGNTFSNVSGLGLQAVPTKSNQVMLGNASITEVRSAGTFLSTEGVHLSKIDALANLPAPGGYGGFAVTSDQGPVWSDGTNWQTFPGGTAAPGFTLI